MSAAPDPSTHLHLAVALDGAGWHPAAWREPDARPRRAVHRRATGPTWSPRPSAACSTSSPSRTPSACSPSHPCEPDERTDQVRGRLDAVLIAARVAPLTRHIGLVPTVVATHTEPFHVSKAIATLDYVSTGRAGVRVQVSARPTRPRTSAAARSRARPATDSPAVAADATSSTRPPTTSRCVRRLWDSWEDDAEIRDVATGRFVDRDKLHYIDFEGAHFSVKGPSITPRPPQGQPLVTALAHRTVAVPAGRPRAPTSASSRRTTPTQARAIVAEIRAEQAAAGRADEPLHVFGDLVVFLDDDRRPPRQRAGTASTTLAGRDVHQRRRRSSPARPPSSPTCCRSGTRPG